MRRFPIDSDTFVLVPDSDPETRYLPDDLPAPFRDDGLRVVFDAAPAPVPPNVRLVGTPIRLLRIRVLEEPRRSERAPAGARRAGVARLGSQCAAWKNGGAPSAPPCRRAGRDCRRA